VKVDVSIVYDGKWRLAKANSLRADVSPLAGQEAELKITADYSYNPQNGLHTYLWLDSINFSTAIVPEPGPLALLGAGFAAFGLAFGFRRWRR